MELARTQTLAYLKLHQLRSTRPGRGLTIPGSLACPGITIHRHELEELHAICETYEAPGLLLERSARSGRVYAIVDSRRPFMLEMDGSDNIA